MPKLRHIAIATNDPKATAEFYKKAFGFEQIGETSPTSPLAQGYFLSDGTLNIAILKFKTDQIGKGMDFTGVHHFGILVDDPEKYTEQLESLGAECFMGKEKGHGKGFFEIKFKGPDGRCSTSPGIPGWAQSRSTPERADGAAAAKHWSLNETNHPRRGGAERARQPARRDGARGLSEPAHQAHRAVRRREATPTGRPGDGRLHAERIEGQRGGGEPRRRRRHQRHRRGREGGP